MPDYFEGDPIPEDAVLPENRDKFDRISWFARHGDNVWKPIVDRVVAALKERGVTRIATTAYCYGAPPAFYLAYSNTSQVTVLSHPSRLQVPADLEVSNDSQRNAKWSLIASATTEIPRRVEGASSHQQL